MAKIKLTKRVVDAAAPATRDYELRDTVVPGLLLKVTPAGRKIFMLQYRTNAGNRRKPTIGRFGELTVEQARSIARDWLADARRGKDPSAEKTAVRAAPSVEELCTKFIEVYSKPKNRPRTVECYQGYIDRPIRRECLDHVMILGESHLRRVLKAYAAYYNHVRPHIALAKDAPLVRPVQRFGQVTARPILGGLHHHTVGHSCP